MSGGRPQGLPVRGYDKVKKVRTEREAKDDAARAQKSLAAKRQAEEEARHTLREAEKKMKVLNAELAELAPGRQLIRFLKERASAEDYRRHLGLVSLVRKDFEQLSSLLTKAGKDKDATLPQIDRIVLYIDDLDRCRANRVIEVLEAVHLLLAFPLFAVVVAVDPRWLRQSLLDHYPRLLCGAEESGTNGRPRTLGRPATPQDYLEKIFQVPFNLQAMNEEGFKTLVNHLFPIVESQPKDMKPAPTDLGVLPSTPMSDIAMPVSDLGLEVKQSAGLAAPPADRTTSSIGGPTTTISPPDPQRLVLTRKEVEDVQRFQPLFQTPRAVKRLANTYCLIRVGVAEGDWTDYLGRGETSGRYRVPMLLLAVTSAFPSLARPWLLWLLETPPSRWQLTKNEVEALAVKHGDTTDRADWDSLALSLGQLALDDWPRPDPKLLREWVHRVARYSF